MKLRIRYENEIQTIELDAKATEEMWVSLSLEGEGLSQKEREELIQKEWKKSPPYQAIFELVVALSPAQPLVFLAIAMCCCLHGAVGKLTTLQQRLGALELASIQLYTLQETSYNDTWTAVLRDEFAQRLYLACLLQQVLYQVRM